ncbi:hypothetical protein BRADI_2g21185v3 [Brachypodium distachyon]|uniref:Uncharacterized protein n=1 Tax=Brachypodium distachyon TaxID=15368 RepID=A0A2K2D9N6_BRADI|nr:hypothetical protein BRADI_2g21185v3 [Brachypodium distachyon]
MVWILGCFPATDMTGILSGLSNWNGLSIWHTVRKSILMWKNAWLR